MTLGYWNLFFIDLAVWSTCLGLVLRHGRLTVLHPALLYFFFHGYTFTFRLFQLANGAPTLFTSWGPQYLPVTEGELERAALVALAALITMTGIWLYAPYRVHYRTVAPSNGVRLRPFSKRLMWMVTSLTLPIGLVFLILLRGPVFSGTSLLSLGDWSGSSYLMSLYQWFGISLLALIFYYGFRPVLLIPFLLYMIVALLSFPFRSMVIIPGLFAVFVYLRRAGVRWPKLRSMLILGLLSLLFVAGKEFGPLLRHGDIDGARDLLSERVADMRSGRHGDAAFMDQLAVALTHIDAQGHFYYGGTYAGLVFLPIPRAIWPGKPGQADWQKEIQTPGRPSGQSGMIVTAMGEAYANFGYLGVIAYSVILAVLMDLLYRWMMQSPYYSLANFWSLCVYSILIQVFRDGLVSFVIFQSTILMPLSMITALHLVSLRQYKYAGNFIGWTTVFDRYAALIDSQGRSRARPMLRSQSYAAGAASKFNSVRR